MLFGLKNAPATFQRVMDHVLHDLFGKCCLVYMDDIIIFSVSLQEHIENLTKIFAALEKVNLKIQLDKSEFLKKEVAFLGHIVTDDGVKPNPSKTEAIQNWPIPKNQKELRGFLGILGYYRRFVRNFATQYFRPYLFGRMFTLYTDHQLLTYALNHTYSRLCIITKSVLRRWGVK